MSSTLEYRRWEPTIPTRLPDIEGLRNDMWAARDLAQRLTSALESGASDYTLLEAWETAAIVRYCRSFTTGKRERLKPQDNPSLLAEDIALHERLCLIRDKHIAHPVNQFETHSVYVGFCATSEPPRVTAISSGTMSGLTLSLPVVSALSELCTKWIVWLQQEAERESASLLVLAQRLSGEELLALPRGPVELTPNPKKVR